MFCSWAWRVGENKDEFRAKGEGSGWRHGEKDEGHVSPFARSKTMFYDYTRASLRLRTAICLKEIILILLLKEFLCSLILDTAKRGNSVIR